MSPRPPPRAKPERCEACNQRGATLGYSDGFDLWVCVGRMACEMRQHKRLADAMADDEDERRAERDEEHREAAAQQNAEEELARRRGEFD